VNETPQLPLFSDLPLETKATRQVVKKEPRHYAETGWSSYPSSSFRGSSLWPKAMVNGLQRPRFLSWQAEAAYDAGVPQFGPI
jgi:hypothetical protein